MSSGPNSPDDLLSEYADLLSDTLILLQSWQRAGCQALPEGAPPDLGPSPFAATSAQPAPAHAARPDPRFDARPDPRPAAPAHANWASRPAAPADPRPELTRPDPAPVHAGWSSRPAVPPDPRPEPPRDPAPVHAGWSSRPAPPEPPRPAPRAEAPRPDPRPDPSRPAPRAPEITPAWKSHLNPAAALAQICDEFSACRRCGRGNVRTRPPIFGVGEPRARLAIISSSLTAEEEQAGTPFVGAEGEMLDKMLQNVLKIERFDAWIVPVLMCRGATSPQPHEIRACRTLLMRQLDIVQPRCVLLMGSEAMMLLPDAARGVWGKLDSHPALPTWHPRELLQHPDQKAAALKHLRDAYQRLQAP